MVTHASSDFKILVSLAHYAVCSILHGCRHLGSQATLAIAQKYWEYSPNFFCGLPNL